MRPHTCRTRSGAWASVHHAGTSRVHWPHSAQPPRVRRHPPTTPGGERPPIHPQSASPSLLPPICVRVPLPQPASGGLGSLLSAITHPTAHAQPNHSNPEIHINLIYSGTADYGAGAPRSHRIEAHGVRDPKGIKEALSRVLEPLREIYGKGVELLVETIKTHPY
jgi:hypothetical protein